jgi:flagellar FliL protein
VAEEEENSAEAAALDEAPKRFNKKKLVLFVILPLILILGIGAGLYFSGMLDSVLHKKAPDATEPAKDKDGKPIVANDVGPGYYYDLPDIIVNLNDGGSKQRFLKLSISLDIPKKEDVPQLEAVMPRITDHFQTYLRELRIDDLRGSAGVYRLRQELLERVRAAADPVVVRDVLFREILVQ